MAKIKTVADLRKMNEELKNKINLREKSDNSDGLVQVKVSMSTCGIASGAKEVMDLFKEKLDKQKIDAVITQTGCMGYCYAEPTIEITLPGKEPVVYGYVSEEKVSEIIEKYIKKGEMIEGIIPTNYQTPND